jgi:hypothetical protein
MSTSRMSSRRSWTTSCSPSRNLARFLVPGEHRRDPDRQRLGLSVPELSGGPSRPAHSPSPDPPLHPLHERQSGAVHPDGAARRPCPSRLVGALQLRSTAYEPQRAATHESIPRGEQPHARSQLAHIAYYPSGLVSIVRTRHGLTWRSWAFSVSNATRHATKPSLPASQLDGGSPSSEVIFADEGTPNEEAVSRRHHSNPIHPE